LNILIGPIGKLNYFMYNTTTDQLITVPQDASIREASQNDPSSLGYGSYTVRHEAHHTSKNLA
jgi:hypothetical protein